MIINALVRGLYDPHQLFLGVEILISKIHVDDHYFQARPHLKNDGFGDVSAAFLGHICWKTQTTDRDRPQQETTPLKEDTL